MLFEKEFAELYNGADDVNVTVYDCNGDGYTNIEKYINGISTKTRIDWRNLNNNYDTLAEKGKLM